MATFLIVSSLGYIKTKIIVVKQDSSAKPGKCVCSFLSLICIAQDVYFQNLPGGLCLPLNVFKKIGKV